MINTSKIRGCMAEAGHTQKDVAKILNLSDVTVNSKLNGKTEFSIKELKTLADTYNKNIAFFLL